MYHLIDNYIHEVFEMNKEKVTDVHFIDTVDVYMNGELSGIMSRLRNETSEIYIVDNPTMDLQVLFNLEIEPDGFFQIGELPTVLADNEFSWGRLGANGVWTHNNLEVRKHLLGCTDISVLMFDRMYRTLKYRNYDWGHEEINKLLDRRRRGEEFTISEHLEAIVVSKLCANRPNGPIYDNLDRIRELFFGFDVSKVYCEKPEYFVTGLLAMSLGNRRLEAQMNELRSNIGVLRAIEDKWGTTDYIAANAYKDIWWAIDKLTSNNSTYKLKGIGAALCFQYLKRLGVDAIKPDVHLMRIFPRWGVLSEDCSQYDVYTACAQIKDYYPELSLTDIGEILWHWCAVDYLDICGAHATCSICPVKCMHYLLRK